MRPKILFFAEAVTSAHVFRPYYLANRFIEEGYEVHFATTLNHPILKNQPQLKIHVFEDSIKSADFLKIIRKGKIPFTEKVLQRNYLQDKEIIEKIQPDYVIDDFRLSLSLTTEQLSLPHVTLNNIPWCPYYKNPDNVIPEIPVVEKLGVSVGGFFFNFFIPYFEKNILKPFNNVRKKMGLRQFQGLQEIYCSGSKVGYLDVPEFAPGLNLPENHQFLGGLLFNFPAELPSWWNQLDRSKQWAYVSLGSSGQSHLLNPIVTALKDYNIEILVSTSGKEVEFPKSKNIHIAKYLPDSEVLKHCDLYIGNGGSGGCQQALAHQTPLIAFPDNFDQWLYTTMLSNLGLAKVVRGSRFNEKSFQQLVEKSLGSKNQNKQLAEISIKLKESQPDKALKNLLGFTDHSEKQAA